MDYLSRRHVRATILVSLFPNEKVIAAKLPNDYVLENGKLLFFAGYWETYFVDGKEYNPDGDRTVEEQRLLIRADLQQAGMTDSESDEFINGLEVVEGRPRLLTFESSNKWLKYHPGFEHEALKVLEEARRSLIETEKVIRPGRK